MGGGGTPRSVKFVKYLPEFGYIPTVFTVAQSSLMGVREFRADHSQLDELRNVSFNLRRIEDPEPRRLRERLERWAVFPLVWAFLYPLFWERQRWWASAAGRALVHENNERQGFRLIYASAAPYSSLLAAAKAASALKIPWVADLRDLWTRDTLRYFPSRLHYRWESGLERRVLGSASAIITNTPLAQREMRQWLGKRRNRHIHLIPNGLDPEDFMVAAKPPTSDKTITVVHAGTLYDPEVRRSRIGRHQPYPLDNEARSPLPVARGLLLLRKHAPQIADRIRIRCLGFTPEASRRAVEQLGVRDQVRFESGVSRADALVAIQNADALLAVQVAFENPARPVPYIPGKIYEYLLAGKPILAPVPPGDLYDLLKKVPAAFVSDYRDSAATAMAIQHMVAAIDTRKIAMPSPSSLAPFLRRNLTKQLAEIFDAVRRHS